MRYMIFVMPARRSPDPTLVPYTGEVHTTKKSALAEYLEADDDPEVASVYLTIV